MRPRQRGFTLIEIVVVVAVIAIAVTVIAVRFDFNRSDDELREQTRRLQVLLHLAWEQAQIEGRSVGLQIERDSFNFVTYDPLQRTWLAMDEEAMFRRRELPEGMTFDLEMEDKDIELPTDDEDENAIRPQVLLLASGEATPFSLFVESDDTDITYELLVDALGDSQIVEHDRGF